jgi:hypothetical protein
MTLRHAVLAFARICASDEGTSCRGIDEAQVNGLALLSIDKEELFLLESGTTQGTYNSGYFSERRV